MKRVIKIKCKTAEETIDLVVKVETSNLFKCTMDRGIDKLTDSLMKLLNEWHGGIGGHYIHNMKVK